MKTNALILILCFICVSVFAQPIIRNWDTTNANPIATSSQAGDVIPDNVTITIDASGKISASGGGTTPAGVTNIVQALKTNLPNVTVTNTASFQSQVNAASVSITNSLSFGTGSGGLNGLLFGSAPVSVIAVGQGFLQANFNTPFFSLSMPAGTFTTNLDVRGQLTANNMVVTNAETNLSLTASTVLEADVNKKIISIPGGEGVLTNNQAGNNPGWNRAPGLNGGNVTNINVFNITNAPNATNYLAASNVVWNAGDIAVYTGQRNADGAMMFTNAPKPSGTGGSVGDPLTNNFGYFQTNNNTASFRVNSNSVVNVTSNGIPVVSLTPTIGVLVSNGAVIINGALPQGGASNTISGTSWITNNLATITPVAHPVTASITNALGTRAYAMVRYFIVGAVTGQPIITFSNTTTGIRLDHSRSAVALIDTNWYYLPTMSPGDVTVIRNESTGSGASTGVLTNIFYPSL